MMENLEQEQGKKPDRVKERKKKSRRQIIIAVLVALTIVGVAGFFWSGTPSFCATCHEIRPHYEKWKVSSHRNVNCAQCHAEPGFFNYMMHKLGSWNYIFVHLLTPRAEIKLKRPIPNSSCIRCHTANRVISPGGDLLVPHQQHVNYQKLNCYQCHKNLHTALTGEREEEEKTVAAAYWHPVCWTQCHDGVHATNKCNACHTRKALPPSHKESGFAREHGRTYAKKIDCAECHGYTRDFCRDCHKKKPKSHLVGNFKATHRFEIKKKGLSTCQACHAADNICLRCHD